MLCFDTEEESVMVPIRQVIVMTVIVLVACNAARASMFISGPVVSAVDRSATFDSLTDRIDLTS